MASKHHLHAYRDTLIGGTTEITRGISGGYVWTARVDSVLSTRLNVSVRRAGTNSNIDVERVPNYVMADIARVMTFGSETGRAVDGNTTNVAFRKFPDGDVIALFPDIPESHDGTMIMSYMHMGQHCGASNSLLTELKPAIPGEYRDLLRELTARGYVVSVQS